MIPFPMKMALKLKAFFKKPSSKWIRFLGLFILLFSLFYLLVPLPNPLFEFDYSNVFLDKNGQLLRAFLNEREQWHFPPDKTRQVPDKLKTAILNFEDRHFYVHPGVNPISLLRAVFQNVKSGRVVSGASTISMQVIRLATGHRRTLVNKVLEVFQTFKLELKYSKEEILSLYVDQAPYGGNIVGYRSASFRYFGREPDQLSWSQAASLAVLPNSPGLISPTTNPEKLKKKRDRLLALLNKRGVISRDVYTLGCMEPLPNAVNSLFVAAPHFSRSLSLSGGLKSTRVQTTIDITIQGRVEELVQTHMQYLNNHGVKNGAVLVAETDTGAVRAYVGSQNFSTDQVDGVLAPRSSGSVLKPFLYALAMDQGLILPDSTIRDIPTFYGSFSPSNADKTYDGLIPARLALTRSLNVPAVRLLNGFGLDKFYLFLKEAGLSTLYRNPDGYGLTLILGGAETTLWDLVTLYRGLGNGGRFSPLKSLNPESEIGPTGDKPLVSPQACYLVLNILKDVKRPGAEYYWEQYQSQKPVAWKTGTSYGQRDGWAVGVTPRFTVGVWVGNFSGEGNTNLSGARSAAPLLFDIFNDLPDMAGDNWFSGDSLRWKRVDVCLETGYLAGPDCPRTVVADAPPSPFALRRCPYHTTVHVSLDDRYHVCSLCWDPGHYKRTTLLRYPPDVAHFLQQRGVNIDAIPPHNPECPDLSGGKPMEIIYPVSRARITIPLDFHGSRQKLTLRVAHRNSDQVVYWYLDNAYRGQTRRFHQMALTLESGWHRLVVVDGAGNQEERRFHITSR